MYESRYDAEGANAAKSALEAHYPQSVISLLASSGTRIVPLDNATTYRAASSALSRLRIDVDGWQIPPAGLFVVEERAVYLRSTSAMTVCHEAGHALDAALGGGVYRSTTDAEIRRAFSAARAFVTPYAASGLDEYFAECVRAYVAANDARCMWPAVSPERLKSLDPAMFSIVESIFAQVERDNAEARIGEQMALFAA